MSHNNNNITGQDINLDATDDINLTAADDIMLNATDRFRLDAGNDIQIFTDEEIFIRSTNSTDMSEHQYKATPEFVACWSAGDTSLRYPNGRSYNLKGHSAFNDHTAVFARPDTVDGDGKVLSVTKDRIYAETYTTLPSPPTGDNIHPRDYWTYTPYMAEEDADITTKKYVDDRMIVSNTEPTSGSVGQQWFNPTTGQLYIYTE